MLQLSCDVGVANDVDVALVLLYDELDERAVLARRAVAQASALQFGGGRRADLDRAVELDPYVMLGHAKRGLMLYHRGRLEEATAAPRYESPQFAFMTPYVTTLLVLALASQRLRPPAADGQSYKRGAGR